MTRFKHVGARAKQLKAQGAKNAKNVAIEQAERDLGRSLTPKEMGNLADEVDATFRDLPVHGGE